MQEMTLYHENKKAGAATYGSRVINWFLGNRKNVLKYSEWISCLWSQFEIS